MPLLLFLVNPTHFKLLVFPMQIIHFALVRDGRVARLVNLIVIFLSYVL